MDNRNKIIGNFFWIIIGKIIQAVLSLVIGGLTARYLGTSNFGVINYVATLIALVLPFAQVGQTTVMVQAIVENPEKEDEIVGSSIVLSLFFSAISYVLVLLFVSIANAGELETVICCGIYGISLFFQAVQLVSYWFHAKMLAKYISIISLVAYLGTSAYKAVLLLNKSSVYFFALSYSFDYLIIAILGICCFVRISGRKLSFSMVVCKRLLSRGKYFIIPGMVMNILGQTDRIMLKNMIGNSSVGIYSAALKCASLTSFVFIAIIDTMRPMVLQKRNVSEYSFDLEITRLFSVIIYMGVAVGVITGLLSKLIIGLLYGKDYLNAAPVLVVVVWHTILSFVGSVRDIWLLGKGKERLLGQINIVGALINVVLNILLINLLGALGAAIASMISLMIVFVIFGFIISELRPCALLMVKGLNVSYILDVCKMIGLNKIWMNQK